MTSIFDSVDLKYCFSCLSTKQGASTYDRFRSATIYIEKKILKMITTVRGALVTFFIVLFMVFSNSQRLQANLHIANGCYLVQHV